VSAARWPGQFGAVAGQLCALLRKQQSGVTIHVVGASSPAAAHRQLLVAIRRIEQLHVSP
jgi:hypothetical protein